MECGIYDKDWGTFGSTDTLATISRRQLLIAGAGVGTALLAPSAFSATKSGGSSSLSSESAPMSYIATKDGTQIFYKDWGDKAAQPIVFHHGWPLSSDDWDGQMLFFLQQGYRVIAHDRRGHGRSTQTSSGNNMDTYADDLATLTEALGLTKAVHIGHSTGGGEVARYIGRHGTTRVAKAVLVSAVAPIMIQSPKNPGGLPKDVFDGIRAGVANNRPEFYRDLTMPFYGFNRPGAKVSEGIREAWWLQAMLGGIKAQYDCVAAFSETDFTEDLKKFDVPTLVMHGEDDQIVPISDSGLLSAKLVKGAQLKVYPGFPHGMARTNPDVINRDLLAFVRG
jgi:non-heme chloroperoxidase